MTRFFEIGRSCGPAIRASCGIAEGCALSVAIVNSLAFLFGKVTVNAAPMVNPIAFADNWSLISKSVSQLRPAWDTLMNLLSALKMQISPTKSWVWASDTKVKAQLKCWPKNAQNFWAKNGRDCRLWYFCIRNRNSTSLSFKMEDSPNKSVPSYWSFPECGQSEDCNAMPACLAGSPTQTSISNDDFLEAFQGFPRVQRWFQ